MFFFSLLLLHKTMLNWVLNLFDNSSFIVLHHICDTTINFYCFDPPLAFVSFFIWCLSLRFKIPSNYLKQSVKNYLLQQCYIEFNNRWLKVSFKKLSNSTVLCDIQLQIIKTERDGFVVTHETRIRESRVQIPWPGNLVEVFSGFLKLKIAKELVIFQRQLLLI